MFYRRVTRPKGIRTDQGRRKGEKKREEKETRSRFFIILYHREALYQTTRLQTYDSLHYDINNKYNDAQIN